MCGRFQFTETGELAALAAEARRRLAAQGLPPAVKTGEVAPTDVVAVLTAEGPRAMAWGYPKPWGEKGVVFNTRTDSLGKNMWRASFEQRRCAVPASGFYEWYHEGGKARKGAPKFRLGLPGREVLYLAGIYEPPGPGQALPHFSILTTEANASLAIGFAGDKIHDRMPVVLRGEECDQWLQGDGRALLDRRDVALDMTPE